jgi:hypothetical protein
MEALYICCTAGLLWQQLCIRSNTHVSRSSDILNTKGSTGNHVATIWGSCHKVLQGICTKRHDVTSG